MHPFNINIAVTVERFIICFACKDERRIQDFQARKVSSPDK